MLGLRKKKVKLEYLFRNKINNSDTKTEVSEIQCCVCMENKKCVLFEPCKHIVSCNNCSKNIGRKKNQCPLCREPIIRMYSVYL